MIMMSVCFNFNIRAVISSIIFFFFNKPAPPEFPPFPLPALLPIFFESLAGDPAWLREATGLRGEPLDDLVHTEVTRRLLATRRAAAMVLFEIHRREGPRTAEAIDRKSTRLNSSHSQISYAVFCLKK